LWERYILSGFNARLRYTAEEKTIIKAFQNSGLLVGINVLHDDFIYLMIHELGDFFSTAFPDLLHTWNKGPVEVIVKFSVTVIYLWNNKDMSKLYLLDERIKRAPYKQSILPFGKPVTFAEGITCFF
jgi:hypothetical protein